MRVGQGHAAAKAQRVELQCLACSDRAADGRLAEPVVVLRDLITPVPMTAAPMVASVIASVPSLTMVPAPETVPAARQLAPWVSRFRPPWRAERLLTNRGSRWFLPSDVRSPLPATRRGRPILTAAGLRRRPHARCLRPGLPRRPLLAETVRGGR